MKALIALLLCVIVGFGVVYVDLYRDMADVQYTLEQYETVYPILIRVEQSTHAAQIRAIQGELNKFATENARYSLTLTDQAELIGTMQYIPPQPTIHPTYDPDFQPIHCTSC